MNRALAMQTTSQTLDYPEVAETPVICIIYNRARLARNLVNTLRAIKPRRILIVADGPRVNRNADDQACKDARAEFERIDWKCSIERHYAEHNLGCEKRIVSGIDWAFGLVEQAVILEDDIDADPRFFSWATRMLDAYADRDDVAMLSGHNPLVRWPNVIQNAAGIPSRRGGIWGWATWGQKWRTVRQTSIDGRVHSAADDISKFGFDASLSALYTHYLEVARQPPGLTWDCDWTLRMAMSDRIAIASPINLIHNIGVGTDATHTKIGDEVLFYPSRPDNKIGSLTEDLLAPANLRHLPPGVDDQTFDRARVLIELLTHTQNPAMAKRLARHPSLPLDRATRLHLLPFHYPKETLHWIDHIAEQGADTAAIQKWRNALAQDT